MRQVLKQIVDVKKAVFNYFNKEIVLGKSLFVKVDGS